MRASRIKVKTKGKDADLYSAFHVRDTSNTHLVTETVEPPASIGLLLRNPSLMDYYSFNRPWRNGWLSWPCSFTDNGRFTHNVVTRPAVSLEQDRESSPARTGGLTTMLRHQQLQIITKRSISVGEMYSTICVE